MNVEEVIFDVAEALRYPVLILALAALALVLVEAGAFAVEVIQRRRRDTARLESVAQAARAALESGDVKTAERELHKVAWSGAMASTLDLIAERVRGSGGADRVAKALADFDFQSLRRLERTRVPPGWRPRTRGRTGPGRTGGRAPSRWRRPARRPAARARSR